MDTGIISEDVVYGAVEQICVYDELPLIFCPHCLLHISEGRLNIRDTSDHKVVLKTTEQHHLPEGGINCRAWF